MSCWTAYLLCGAGGAIRAASVKRGDLLRFDSSMGVPLEEVADGWFDQRFCRGVAFDEPGRRLRCFPCYADNALAAVGQAAREAWPGWDAGVAVGGREEFVELLPEAARVVRPYDISVPRPVPLPHDTDWFVGWDPTAFALTVREDADSANWSIVEYDLATVVTAGAAAHEFRLQTVDTHPIHPLLSWLQGGRAATRGLRVPFPPGDEECVRTAVLIDHRHHLLEYRLTDLTPARLVDAVADAWPGWRLRAGDATAGSDVRRPAIRVLG